MRYVDSIFASLLKPIDRRQFQAIVERHDGDAYDKTFKSWDHLVALIFAQLSHADSLRGLEAASTPMPIIIIISAPARSARSTLSDANARRPVGVFAETFAMLSEHGRPADAARGRRDGAPDRRLADPARQDVRLGEVERPHPRHEDARRLRSEGRLSARGRDHARHRQRCRDRPPGGDRGRRDLRFRQGLLSLRLVDEDRCCRGLLRHAAEG